MITQFFLASSVFLLFSGSLTHASDALTHASEMIFYPLEEKEPKIQYSKGSFPSGEDETQLYTIPYHPPSPAQSPISYQGQPKIFADEKACEESILMRSIEGIDRRKEINEPTKWPYLFHGQLSLYFSDGEYGGSGTLIGPHHLLTAAHNVYNYERKEWTRKVVVRLALKGNVAPYGEAIGTKIYAFRPWVEKKDKYYDLALVLLDQSLGFKTGWGGLLCEKALKNVKINVTGYPGDKGCKTMWTMRNELKSITNEEIFYDIDTYFGQSGSGIWIESLGMPYIIGIHTLGERISGTGNSGVRLSLEKMKFILQRIEENYILNIKDKDPFPLYRSVKRAPIRQIFKTEPNKHRRGINVINNPVTPSLGAAQPTKIGPQPSLFPQTQDFMDMMLLDSVSLNEAKAYYEQEEILDSLTPAEIKAYYEQGEIYESQKKIQEALEHYELASNANYAPAQYKLGDIYFYQAGCHLDGNGKIQYSYRDGRSDKDMDTEYGLKMIALLEKAAAQNHVKARKLLIWIYKQRKGFQDPQKAYHHLQKLVDSEEANNKEVFELADVYRKGIYIEKNLGASISLYHKAAAKGEAFQAYKNLTEIAKSQSNKEDTDKYYELAIKNTSRATEYRELAKLAHSLTKYKDEINYYTQAEEKGDIQSADELGKIYEKGREGIIRPDLTQAIQCYEKVIKYYEEIATTSRDSEAVRLAQKRIQEKKDHVGAIHVDDRTQT